MKEREVLEGKRAKLGRLVTHPNQCQAR